MLPEEEVRKFFGLRLSKFPESFRSEVANYFNLPFDYVLKRANFLGMVSEQVIDEARHTHRRRGPCTAPGRLAGLSWRVCASAMYSLIMTKFALFSRSDTCMCPDRLFL